MLIAYFIKLWIYLEKVITKLWIYLAKATTDLFGKSYRAHYFYLCKQMSNLGWIGKVNGETHFSPIRTTLKFAKSSAKFTHQQAN